MPSTLWVPGICTVRGNVQTSDASGQWKTCICLPSCCLWLTSCSGQARLHICQQILALPQHSKQIAFCHKSYRLPPCICTMHVCACLSHLLPGWLLTLLPLEQISWLFDLWHALGMGSHLWRCQTHWALAACSLIEFQGVGIQLLSFCWAPPRLSPCPCPFCSQELLADCHKYEKPTRKSTKWSKSSFIVQKLTPPNRQNGYFSFSYHGSSSCHPTNKNKTFGFPATTQQKQNTCLLATSFPSKARLSSWLSRLGRHSRFLACLHHLWWCLHHFWWSLHHLSFHHLSRRLLHGSPARWSQRGGGCTAEA